MQLPQEPGFYLWYILDLGYINVGLVHCLLDKSISKSSKITDKVKCDMSYKYRAGYRNIDMVYQAHDNRPPCNEFGMPIVDGWIPFDFRLIDHFSIDNLNKFNPNHYR